MYVLRGILKGGGWINSNVYKNNNIYILVDIINFLVYCSVFIILFSWISIKSLFFFSVFLDI